MIFLVTTYQFFFQVVLIIVIKIFYRHCTLVKYWTNDTDIGIY